MKNKIIFVACDTSNLNQIKKILKNINTKKLKIIPKFGLQFFYSNLSLKNVNNIIFANIRNSITFKSFLLER